MQVAPVKTLPILSESSPDRLNTDVERKLKGLIGSLLRKAGWDNNASAITEFLHDLVVHYLGKYESLNNKHRLSETVFDCLCMEAHQLFSNRVRQEVPVSYRIYKRVEKILGTYRDTEGKEMFFSRPGDLFGLMEWSYPPRGSVPKITASSDAIASAISQVFRPDLTYRKTGKARSPLLISNPDLAGLTKQFLIEVDGFVPRREICKALLSILGTEALDPTFQSVESNAHGWGSGDRTGENPWNAMAFSVRDKPTDQILATAVYVDEQVERFLLDLAREFKFKSDRFNIALSVIMKLLATPSDAEEISQISLANTLGKSNSLVSDYEGRIKRILREIPFSSADEALSFSGALIDRIEELWENLNLTSLGKRWLVTARTQIS